MAGPVSQRGVVLLSVLLVLALLSALAWQLVGKHSLVIAQARFSYTADQTLEYALGAEAFARQALYEEWAVGGPDQDTLEEVWAQPVAPFEMDHGYMEVQVRDLNRCFNLNSLAGSNAQQNLERLKTLLRNRNLPETLADAWLDWVDADQDIDGFGAEDGEYLLEDPPYRTANQPAVHESEFRLLRGYEPEYAELLEGLLCVLPSTDLKLNINTVHAAVLAAMSPNLAEQQLQPFAESVREYASVAQVTQEYPDLAAAVDALSVTSEYFEVNVRARIDEGQTELSSLLRRDPSTGEIELISRNFGRDFRSLFSADDEAEEGS